VNDRGTRRFSQAIAEGDGISVIAEVDDPDSARSAEADGAEAISVMRLPDEIRRATSLPIFWRGGGELETAREWGADACLLSMDTLGDEGDALERFHREAVELGLDCVIEVSNEEDLEHALERIDPDIFLLSSRSADTDEEELDRVLDLLPDVPAGKLAIAALPVSDREEVLALERAGIDAVIVRAAGVSELVGDESGNI
jgi:indole-3-glycerol phosphate synthase